VTVSGALSYRGRDGLHEANAIAWSGGEIDDRMAWLSDCCNTSKEGGAASL
jgi:hypothetical protein